jgi:hypothetical protein
LVAVTDIVNNQRISKILVGDKHQQIYAFRGAVNAMMKIDSTVTYYLTKVYYSITNRFILIKKKSVFLVISFWI